MSVTAGYGVAFVAEVGGEVSFHLGGGFEGHWIQMRVEFGEEAEAVAFYN